MSADSVVPDQFSPQSYNRYSYVLNNPLVYTDPSGHLPSYHELADDKDGSVERDYYAGDDGRFGGFDSGFGREELFSKLDDNGFNWGRIDTSRNYAIPELIIASGGEPSHLFNAMRGSGSYLRGLYRAGRYGLRLSGYMGEEEQQRAELEGLLEREILKEILENHKLDALEIAKQYTLENKARMAGRLGTAAAVSTGLTTAGAGFPGMVAGQVLSGYAAHGDAIYGIEAGIRTAESYVIQSVGGGF